MTKFIQALILGILFSLFFGCTKDSSPLDKEFALKGYTISEIAGSTTKRVRKFGADGKYLLEEGYIRDGKKNGLWTTYYDNYLQRVKSIAHYVDDQLEGNYIDLDYMSRVDLSTRFENNQIHGFRATYRLTTPIDFGEYHKGKLDGKYMAFDERGMLNRVATYRQGALNGISTLYQTINNIETPMMEYLFENGKKVREKQLR